MYKYAILLVCLTFYCHGETPTNVTKNDLSERIGNFSLELLYHTAKSSDENLIVSPITAWTVIAVIAEGAVDDTLSQIIYGLRLNKNFNVTRRNLLEVSKWLQGNTSTVELAKLNALFVDSNQLPLRDFQLIAKAYYDTEMVPLNFTDGEKTAKIINNGISKITHGRISKLVESSFFGDTVMILSSVLYFKGQWTSPFNATFTKVRPFYDTNGKKMGEVNMMYNRYTYPFASIDQLKARIIELPYGNENRLSMLIMLPNPGVSLEDMFLNFKNVPLDLVFKELKLSKEEYAEDEVDCFIPRFKIDSNILLTDTLKKFGIEDLFDKSKAQLPKMSKLPVFVSKVIHKAEIEVTEEGTVASGVTSVEFSNRIGAVRFDANRPFSYMIVEKMTNTIVFGGIYRHPSLY